MNSIFRVLGDAILSSLMAILLLITVSGVFMRYVMHDPLHWVEEISGLLMVWIVFMGVFFAERDYENLTISFLVDKFKSNWQRFLAIILGLLSVAVLIFSAWLGWELANSVQARSTRILGVSLFWIYIPVTIGFSATAILMLTRVVKGGVNKNNLGDKL